MSHESKKLSPRDSIDAVISYVQQLSRYSLLIFLAFIVVLYGFVVVRINALSNQQPTDEQVTSQVQAAQVPHIDQSVVNQLQSLQDNSVNVQTLFDQARSNPFQ